MQTLVPPTKRIIRINASALKISACPLAFYYTVVEGYAKPINDVSVEFGSALHLFLSTMYKTEGRVDLATEASRTYFETTKMYVPYNKKYLDTLHLCRTNFQAWEYVQSHNDFQVIKGADGKPAVEITFSNPFYEDEYVEVRLEGTIDKIGKIVNGIYCIADYKSTSSRDIEEYFRGYELSTQLKFYVYNLLLFAKLHPDSLVAEVCKNQVGAFIEGIFLNGKDKTEFARSRIFLFKEQELNLYKAMLTEKIMQLVDYVKGGMPPYPYGMITDTCSKPEGNSAAWRCRFFNACSAPDAIAKAHILKDPNQFVKREYKPLENANKSTL
jgi:hypothetical protein